MIEKNGKKKLLTLDSLKEVRATIGIYQLRKFIVENKYENLLDSLKKYGRRRDNN